MYIVEGTYQGKKIEHKPYLLLTTEYGTTEQSFFGDVVLGKDEYIYFKNKLVSVEVVSQEQATGGGVQGAAGGALVGFLLAGPLGSAIGAGIGRNKSGKDNTILAITWTNGDFWVVEDVDNKELTALKLAVATAKPKQISTSSKKTPQKTTQKKVPHKDGVNIKKPKFPKYPWEMKPLKGRVYLATKSDKRTTTTLPSLPRIKEIQNIDGDKSAIKLFRNSFGEELEKYNNWKWVYFDLKIESDIEINNIAQKVLEKLIVDFNKKLKAVDKPKVNPKNLEFEIKSLEESEKKYLSQLKMKKQEIEEVGFFSKGRIKKEITTLEEKLNESKKNKSNAKRALTRTNKAIKSSEEIKEEINSIPKGSLEFVSIYANMFPNEKKPSKTGISEVSIDQFFFLKTYKKIFDETWDKRIRVAIKEQKEKEAKKVAETKKKDMTTQPEPAKSKKDQLIELKELLEQELISEDEYEQSRKKILGLDS